MKHEQIRALADQIDEWIDHPITKLIHEYYRDFREDIVEAHNDTLRHGGIIDLETQARDSEKCLLLTELSEITVDDIERFYDESSLRNSTD